MTEGIIGVAIGAVITLLGSIIMVKFNYHDLFAKTVSEERSKWLKEMRDHATALISFLKSSLPVKGQIANENQNFTSLSMPILLRLNPNKEVGSYDEKISILIKGLEEKENGTTGNTGGTTEDKEKKESDNKEVVYCEKKIADLQKAFEEMFKEEWEKVKLEAKGISTNSLTKNKVGVTFFNYAIWSIIFVAFIMVLSMATTYCHNYIGRHFKSDISLLQTSLWIVFGAICLTALIFVLNKFVHTKDLLKKESKKLDREVKEAETAADEATKRLKEAKIAAVKAAERLKEAKTAADEATKRLKEAKTAADEATKRLKEAKTAADEYKNAFTIALCIAIIIVTTGVGAVIGSITAAIGGGCLGAAICAATGCTECGTIICGATCGAILGAATCGAILGAAIGVAIGVAIDVVIGVLRLINYRRGNGSGTRRRNRLVYGRCYKRVHIRCSRRKPKLP